MKVGLTAALVTVAAVLTPAARADDWFGRDKAKHFGASAALAVGGYGAASLFTARQSPRLVTGAALALTAGIGKEIADRYRGGDPSMRDVTWDVLGTASGLLVAWALDRAWSRLWSSDDRTAAAQAASR